MTQTVMTMKILIPFQVFEERTDVTNIVAETSAGSFGILPRRLDCVASIVPGILIYETVGGQEKYAALDEGVLVKTGYEVFLSVRRANKGGFSIWMKVRRACGGSLPGWKRASSASS